MNWNQVTIKQFQEFHAYCQEKKEFNLYDYDINSISFFEDMPMDEIEDLSISDFNALRKRYIFARDYPQPIYKNQLEISGITFHLLDDFMKISIGEYIDLDHYCSKDSGGYIQNLGIILAICYRQKTNENPLLYDDVYEKYGNWVQRRASLFENIPVQNVYGVIKKFEKFKEEFKNLYPNLISEKVEQEKVDYSNMTKREILELQEEMKHEEARDQFGWELLLYNLAKMNNCTFEQVTEMPLTLAFGLRSMQVAFKINI